MLETWVSKEILISNTTPWFLTDDEDLIEQPLSDIQSFRLLHAKALGPIIKPVFLNLAVGIY